MKQSIKIGTRASELAMYQAELVALMLNKKGISTQIVKIDSEGDANLIQPIYKIGFSGVFTKSLDTALINHKIDIAVHSLKDVPTNLADGIKNLAVLKRADSKDILVFKGSNIDFSKHLVIGTGSIRRKAQWLNKYPSHKIEGLRGNVNTRLNKIQTNSHWKGAVFAKAGLKRINLLKGNFIDLDWMIPAPAQGAIVVSSRLNDNFDGLRKILNHQQTEICTTIERDFMNAIQAGCSSPVGAIATIKSDIVNFKGLIISLDGKEKVIIEKSTTIDKSEGFGLECAKEIKTKHQSLIDVIKAEIQELG
ncbi:MAG TPA: hydroxymethylbilane synthase [Crocinitomix sp.]|nr:hydroxymethylbilane synthase [Crocinitomix sp.]